MVDDLVGVAERIVKTALAMKAEQAEAFVLWSRGGSVRIEKNEVGGVETETAQGIGLRVVRAGRVGFAHLTRLEEGRRAVQEAFDAAKVGRRLASFRFAAPRKIPSVGKLHDQRIDALDGPDIIEAATDMVRAAQDRDAKLNVTEAGVSFGSTRVAISNSEGVGVSSAETSIGANCFVVQSFRGVSTGFAHRESTRLDLDASGLGREAADLALAARDPSRWERPGKVPIVLRPDPAADLLGTITLGSLYGKPAHRGESFYSGKKGKRVVHPKISLVDDPTRPGGLGSSPFDDEGEPSRVLRPLQAGVLKTFLYDRSSAAEFHAKTTGSALRVHPFDGRSYKSPPAASGRNVRLEAPRTKTSKLVAGIDDGLLVHDLMGVHTANLVSGDFSVTSTVLFRIRSGAVEGPVAPLSIAGNFHETLRHGVTLGDDVKQTGDEAAIEIASTRVDDFAVTP